MINAAIVGLGNWGRTLVRSIAGKSDIVRFTHGVARTPEKTAAFAKEMGLEVTASYDAVLADPDIDFIVLATPHSQHAAQIAKAASAGKHVLCEKPLTLTAQDARASFDICKKHGVSLGVAQNRRFLPAVGRLRTMIADGELGKMLHFEANFSGPSGFRFEREPQGWRANDTESPAGMMTARGLHMSDLMIDFGGLAIRVFAICKRDILDIPFDDTVAVMLEFESGATAHLSSLATTAETWRFDCFGTKGHVELRDQNTLVYRDIDSSESISTFDSVDTECAELEAFATALQGGQTYPVKPREAINNIAILEAIVTSSKTGEAVSLPQFAQCN